MQKFAIVLEKNFDTHLLKMIEGTSAFETYKDIVDKAPEKNIIMRTILTEVPLVCSIDIEAYILSHQSIHSGLMNLNPNVQPKLHHLSYMTRLLDGLSDCQRLTMQYLKSCWDDRSKATLKMFLKLVLS